MAGALAQTNCTLLQITDQGPLSDSFVSDAFGSGSGEGNQETTLWAGSVGAYLSAESSLESSTDGRDEITTRQLFFPCVCSIAIGNKVRLLDPEGEEKIWKISGFAKRGPGYEVGASQFYSVQIEVS